MLAAWSGLGYYRRARMMHSAAKVIARELGATVCTPRGPGCLTCPVIEMCATRGEMGGGAKAARQKKKEIHYALSRRDGEVFLVQRARDASLMAGMWELPEAVVARAREKQVPRSARNDKTL